MKVVSVPKSTECYWDVNLILCMKVVLFVGTTSVNPTLNNKLDEQQPVKVAVPLFGRSIFFVNFNLFCVYSGEIRGVTNPFSGPCLAVVYYVMYSDEIRRATTFVLNLRP